MIDKNENFRKELEQLINKYSMENASNTPNFILADYLWQCLVIFNSTSWAREDWYGKHLSIGGNEL